MCFDLAMRKPKKTIISKPLPLDEFQLCYVDGNIMYFTDNFEGQCGDDWDDAPYEHNADPPYRYASDLPDNSYRGHILLAAWFSDQYDVLLPRDGTINSSYSVEDINAGAVAWLYKRGKGGLRGGATVAEAREFCKKYGIYFAVLENQNPFEDER